MARKQYDEIDDLRSEIKAKYKRGPRTTAKTSERSDLEQAEYVEKCVQAAFLKASGFSYTDIGTYLGLSRGLVRAMFAEPGMTERVAKIMAMQVEGAAELLRTYAIGFVQRLVDIIDTTEDEALAMKGILEGLDRVGLTKVNKSESVSAVTRKEEVEITDTTGLLTKMQGAPPEVQAQVAQKLEDAWSLVTEHNGAQVLSPVEEASNAE